MHRKRTANLAIDYPTTPATSPSEEIILIRAIEIAVEEKNESLNESITKHEAGTSNQASCFATPESQKVHSEPTISGSISSLMAKLKISSKRLRVLRTRYPYERRLKFEKQESRNEMSSLLFDETTKINEQEELMITSNVDETANRELPLSGSSVVGNRQAPKKKLQCQNSHLAKARWWRNRRKMTSPEKN